MEWYLTPKILHLYWGADKMSYLRYLTVKSFIHHNPDWRVVLWQPLKPSVRRTWDSNQLEYEVNCDDWTDKITELPVEMHKVDFSVWGFSNDMSEVHKSDYLRLYLLTYWGGVWSDMDIIYIKPITHLKVNTKDNADKDTFVSIGHYGHSAGFLMSRRGSAFFKEMMVRAEEEYNPKEYQGIGATMFNKLYPKAVPGAVDIGMEAVYAHNALDVKNIIGGTTSRFTKHSIGIHLYLGHPLWDRFIKDTNGGLTNIPDTIIGRVLNNIDY